MTATRLLLIGIVALALCSCGEKSVENAVDDSDFYSAWSAVTVGVASLDEASRLWVDEFGFNVVSQSDGPDAELARLWNLQPGDIARQALLRTNDSPYGMIHFVEFNDPDDPVRKGAQVFDRVPKNLDIYVQDLPGKVADLRERGRQFRTENHSEVTAPDGTAFREIHMPSHDDINIVLLEVVGKDKPFSDAGYAGVGPLIFIVPDAGEEKAFFEALFLLDKLNDNILEGPEIERMVGLPPGAALDVSIWGREGQDLGGIEIIEYRGVSGTDLYPRARPKALGILHINYVVADATALRERLAKRGVEVTDHGRVSSLLAAGDVFSFTSPAGLRIEIVEQ
jgi:catechol 2,3-dioxygenase-like lactoylglutathione lyase family enzyme